jgi:hypothetical protein
MIPWGTLHSSFLHLKAWLHCHSSTIWLGIFTSFVASLVYLAFALCIAFYLRECRANPFVPVYKMYDPKPPHAPRDPDGRVTVEHERRFWDTDTTAKLKVYARGAAASPMDRNGTLDVRGLSDVATGFYLHSNHYAGGFLQFTRVGESEIMEQAQIGLRLAVEFNDELRDFSSSVDVVMWWIDSIWSCCLA